MFPTKSVLPTLLLTALAPLNASLLTGTVNFNGNVIISSGLVHFVNSVGAPPGVVNVTSSTGDFMGEAGGMATVKDIDSLAFPIPTGSGFLADFITAVPIPATTHFNMTFLFPGIQGTLGCTIGNNCTPANSPYNLTNTSPFTSIASFAISGTEVDTLTGTSTPFNGVFTAQFGETLQQVLATFATNGSVTTSFSGTIIIPQNPVPEPGPMVLGSLGLGLIGLVRLFRKQRG